jgi:GR25 family glycosyltransferase involved in LPS biosynthesis
VKNIKSSICFNVLHIESGLHGRRDTLAKSLNSYLSTQWVNLHSAAVTVESLADFECMHQVHFKTEGFLHAGEFGWKMGEIGLWFSSIEMWKKFLQSSFEYLIVCEDDMVAQNLCVEIVEGILQKQRKFDVLSLFVPENEYGRWKKRFYERKKKGGVTRIFQDWSTGAYAMTKKGAERVLKSLNPEINQPLDWHLWRDTTLNCLSLKPTGPVPFQLIDLPSTFQSEPRTPLIRS